MTAGEIVYPRVSSTEGLNTDKSQNLCDDLR